MNMRTLLTLPLCGLLLSCVGTDIGNPEQNTEVTVEYQAYEPQPQGGLLLETGIALAEAWIVVEALEIRDADGCVAPAASDAAGPFVIELISGKELPSTPVFTRPTTSYCELRFKLTSIEAGALPAGAPSELAGNSVLLRGARGDAVPFVLTALFSDTIVLRAAPSFTLQAERDPLIIALDLSAWLDVSGLDAIVVLLGEISIDPSSHPDIIAHLRTQLTGALTLVRDSNSNGLLDFDELISPLAQP